MIKHSSDTLLLKSSRVKWGLILIVSLGFVAIGIFLLREGDASPLMASFVIGFFGLCLLVSMLQIIRPATLILTPYGFQQNIFGRELAYAWNEVSEFGTYGLRNGLFTTNTFVNFSPLDSEENKLTGVAKAMTGHTAQLGDNFGMKPKKLADLMNEYRNRSLGERP